MESGLRCSSVCARFWYDFFTLLYIIRIYTGRIVYIYNLYIYIYTKMYTQFNKQNTLHIFQLLLGCCKVEKKVYWELVCCVTSCWFLRSNALTARYPVWKGRGWAFCQIALWPWDDDIPTTQPNMGVSSYPKNPQNEYGYSVLETPIFIYPPAIWIGLMICLLPEWMIMIRILHHECRGVGGKIAMSKY